MKKVIAAAAGLMLVGTMAGSAIADVSFSGDGRARFLYQQNYDLGESKTNEETGVTKRVREQDNVVTSRARFQMRGVAAGGAYVVGRVNLGDGTWDGGNSGTKAATASKGYIGVPMGMTLLEAGRNDIPGLDATKFFEHDIGRDGLTFKIMPSDMTTITLGYYISYEAAVNGDTENDDDESQYALWVDLKFAGDWSTRLGVMYNDDAVANDGRDDDGAYGGIEFMGPGGPVAVSGAFAFDDRGEGDTGYGGFLKGGMQFGATGVALTAGFANDGFIVDGDHGFVIAGGGQSIRNSALDFGKQGDTWWIGVPVSFAVSEMLTLQANLAYVDMDANGDGVEVSGSIIYAISDGAAVDLDLGYFGWSAPDGVENDESPFGAGLTFSVSF